MSTDTTSQATGFIHEAAFYDSEGGLLDVVITFLEEAVQAGEPGPDRIAVTGSDQGQGPTNPFVGLIPSQNSESAGMGLWLAHQLCSHVTFETNQHGYTLRLVLGDPHLDLRADTSAWMPHAVSGRATHPRYPDLPLPSDPAG